MSDLQQLLALDPEQAIVKMLNNANQTSYRLDGFTFGTPVSRGGIVTEVLLTSKVPRTAFDDQYTDGVISFTYNRLDMGGYLTGVLAGYHPQLPLSTQNILNEITARIGQAFYIDDMILEEVTRDNGALYRLKAKPESLRWYGSIDLPLIALTPLSSLFNANLLTGSLRSEQVTFSPNVHLPFVNATDYRELAVTLMPGQQAQDRISFVTLFNAVVPDPTPLGPTTSPWHVSTTPGPFNLYNATIMGTGDGTGVNPAIPSLERGLMVRIDGTMTTNFASGQLTIPYTNVDFNTTGSTDMPRLQQGSSVSLSNGSAFGAFLNGLQEGSTLSSVPDAFLIDGASPWIVNVGLPKPTNLAGATIIYNGQRRSVDLPAATQGLDRILVVRMTTDNSEWEGTYSFYYNGPIRMDITALRLTVGSESNVEFNPTAGTGPFTFVVVGGALPDGLVLNGSSGHLGGVASKVGDYSYDLAITDANGTTEVFTVTHRIDQLAQALSLNGTLAAGATDEPYVQFLDVRGGLAPYGQPSVVAGFLPPSIQLSLTGSSVRVAGLWPAADTYHFSIGITSADGQSTSLSFQLVVTGSGYAALTLLGDYADGVVGTPYSSDLDISGGNGIYVNPTLAAGDLPEGLSLSMVESKLRVSGTPTEAADYPFVVAVDSTDGQSVTRSVAITITAEAVEVPDVAIAGTLPNGKVNTSYAASLDLSGGTGSYSNPQVGDGSPLPEGLSLSINGSQLVVSGVPSRAFDGSVQFTVDSSTKTGDTTQALMIADAPVQQYQHWKYLTNVALGDNTSYAGTGVDDSAWSEGAAPFGNADDYPSGLTQPNVFDSRFSNAIGTTVPLNVRTWIRRELILDAVPEGGFFFTGFMDNSFIFYVNGVQALTGQTTSGVGTKGVLPASLFHVGSNVLAAACDDDSYNGHPDASYFDFLLDPRTAADSLVTELDFNEAAAVTNFVDTAGYTSWTTNGDTKITPGKPFLDNTPAVYFDGSGDFLQAIDPTITDFQGLDYTAEAWVCVDAYGTVMQVAGIFSDGDGRVWQLALNRSGGLNYLITSWSVGSSYDSARDKAMNSPELLDERWVHVAESRQGNNLYAFVMGKKIATYSPGSDVLASAVGARLKIGGNNQSQWFKGFMKYLRIYKGYAKYTADFDPFAAFADQALIANLPFHVDFSDTAGTAWTVNGPVTIDTSHDDGTGKGIGARFGASDLTYLQTPSTAAWQLARADWTVDAFLRVEAGVNWQSYNAMLAKHLTNNVSRSAISFLFGCANGKLNGTVYDASTQYSVDDPDAFPTGARVHVAWVRAGRSLMLFVNGVLKATTPLPAAWALNVGSAPVTIGHVMRIDEVEPGLVWPGLIEGLRVRRYAAWTQNFTVPQS